MSRLIYSPAAQADLDGIWAYTVAQWSKAQAANYVRDLAAACAAIAAGEKPSQAIDNIRPGYRKVYVRRHVIFYRSNDDGDTVVVRILHQRMDVLRHLSAGD